MERKQIPDIVVSRLPQYLLALQTMQREGHQIISSKELGNMVGYSAAQIRKDLSCFGEFGKQGTGYHIEHLIHELCKILNLEKEWSVALVGVGELGIAIARYKGFIHRGFKVKIVFDIDPAKIGTQVGEFTVYDASKMVEIIRLHEIKIAMLAVPAEAAQKVTNKLVEAGIKAILNYAPINVSVPTGVQVQYIDPSIHLQRMTYHLR